MRRLPPLLVLCLILLGPIAAAAGRQGPEPTDTSPKAGTAVREAPDEVSMTFSEPLDPSSQIEVKDQCGRVVSGDTEVAVDEMSTDLKLKPKGHYTVHWTATGLGGASGTNEGSFAFHVYQGDPCDPDRGGKGNHNHNNNGGPKNNHHGGNNKHRGGQGNGPGGDHNGSAHSGDHSSTSSTEHSSGTHSSTDQGDHSGAGGHQNRSRHGDHRKEKGSGHGKHQGPAGGRPDKSNPSGRSDGGKPTGTSENDALNLLLVLLLPALLGTTGGAVLRTRIA